MVKVLKSSTTGHYRRANHATEPAYRHSLETGDPSSLFPLVIVLARAMIRGARAVPPEGAYVP